jgi:hypothetical protein
MNPTKTLIEPKLYIQHESHQKIDELTQRSSALSAHLNLEEKQGRLEEVLLEMENPNIWLNILWNSNRAIEISIASKSAITLLAVSSSLLWDVFIINSVEQLQTLPKTQSEIDISPFLKTQKHSILYSIICIDKSTYYILYILRVVIIMVVD